MNVGVSLNGDNNIDLIKFSNDHNIKYWYACDGGVKHLEQYNIAPKSIVGDLDSINKKYDNIIKKEEQLTSDSEFLIKYLNEKYDDLKIFIVGAIGNNRIEHFYNNLITINDNNVEIYLENNIVYFTNKPIEIKYDRNCNYISFFAISSLKNLTIENAKYNIFEKDIQTNESFGLSNEFVIDQDINLLFDSGKVMIIKSIK